MYIDADSYIKYCEENWIPLNVDAVLAQKKITDVRENVHAHWDTVEVKKGEWWHTCSKCKATWGSEDGEFDFNYCPNCGAEMESE